MRKFLSLICAGPMMVLAGAAFAAQAGGDLVDTAGQSIGSVTIATTASGMLHLTVEARSLPPGPHGFHIHETGVCDADNGFKGAGGHLAGNHEHGIEAAQGPHPGDFPNVHVGRDGVLMVEFFSERLSLEGEDSMLDEDGAAVIIHADADDYSSQPSGNAGDRIACAVIEAR